MAAIGADAIGAEHVVAVSMPSSYSSGHSKDDAAEMAKRIGLDYRVVPIAPMVQAFLDNLGLSGIAEENLQARVRGVILMGLSNQEGHLTLTTGNKSEMAVGYSTIYGDSVGGYAPLKDVPKTLVWALSRWRNAQASGTGEVAPIPENSITKPPSAELRPDQTDQDSLPPYDLLDDLLNAYVEGAQGRSELIASGFDPEVVDGVVTMVDRAEWKRRQSAPGPKISRSPSAGTGGCRSPAGGANTSREQSPSGTGRRTEGHRGRRADECEGRHVDDRSNASFRDGR